MIEGVQGSLSKAISSSPLLACDSTVINGFFWAVHSPITTTQEKVVILLT